MKEFLSLAIVGYEKCCVVKFLVLCMYEVIKSIFQKCERM